MIQIRHCLICVFLICAGCTTTGTYEEGESILVEDEMTPQAGVDAVVDEAALVESVRTEEGGEVPLAVAETEPLIHVPPEDGIGEVVVEARVRGRHEMIRDLVSEARILLHDIELEYAFTGRGRNEVLRGRPVIFAAWSDANQQWSIVHIEIPRPPISWRPGGKPIRFTVRTPGIQARHVKGTGAERLMFAFSKDGEQLKVYGRKFPVFDSGLLAKKRWRDVVRTAKPLVYLPFTEDTLDPLFVTGGKEYLLAMARQAVEELRLARAPAAAFPGELLADVVPAEVIATLAVIEQTDDNDFRTKKEEAFNEVLSQYGLKREEAYRYSVSTANALGPMQFTNRRGNGTYALVVRRCPAARLDPNFERGATDLLNAMKAAICLFDIELAQMRADIRLAYRDNMKVLGIFPVAAYNGGPKNVGRLHAVMQRMKVKLEELRPRGEEPQGSKVICPCLWKAATAGVVPVSIPRYNNENRWYIEKYQSILNTFE